jgi:hypothetical protein
MNTSGRAAWNSVRVGQQVVTVDRRKSYLEKADDDDARHHAQAHARGVADLHKVRLQLFFLTAWIEHHKEV